MHGNETPKTFEIDIWFLITSDLWATKKLGLYVRNWIIR